MHKGIAMRTWLVLLIYLVCAALVTGHEAFTCQWACVVDRYGQWQLAWPFHSVPESTLQVW